MSSGYTWIADLAAEVEIPENGTLSRTVHQDDSAKVILFGFDAGQELSEHTASRPAILHILQGQGRVMLGADTFEVKPGSWAHMPPNLPHSIHASTPLLMLLILLK